MPDLTFLFNHLQNFCRFANGPQWQREIAHLRELAGKKDEDMQKELFKFLNKACDNANKTQNIAVWHNLEKFLGAIAKSKNDDTLLAALNDVQKNSKDAGEKKERLKALLLDEQTIAFCCQHIKEFLKLITPKNEQIANRMNSAMNDMFQQADTSVQQVAYSQDPLCRFTVNLIFNVMLPFIEVLSLELRITNRIKRNSDEEGGHDKVRFLPQPAPAAKAH